MIQGAAILKLGASIIAPPDGQTLSATWLTALASWAKISLAIVAPLLAVAALAEVFVTPRVVLWVLGG